MKHQYKAAGAVALVLGSGLWNIAQAETWRMAHKMPAESIEGQMFQAVADRIGETTGGEVSVEVYPSEQLGSDDAILEQLQLGTVQIYPEGSTFLQKWVPDIKYTSAPFLFDDREHWVRFMNSDLVKGWMNQQLAMCPGNPDLPVLPRSTKANPPVTSIDKDCLGSRCCFDYDSPLVGVELKDHIRATIKDFNFARKLFRHFMEKLGF